VIEVVGMFGENSGRGGIREERGSGRDPARLSKKLLQTQTRKTRCTGALKGRSLCSEKDSIHRPNGLESLLTQATFKGVPYLLSRWDERFPWPNYVHVVGMDPILSRLSDVAVQSPAFCGEGTGVLEFNSVSRIDAEPRHG
jgi:hypothetical protein